MLTRLRLISVVLLGLALTIMSQEFAVGAQSSVNGCLQELRYLSSWAGVVRLGSRHAFYRVWFSGFEWQMPDLCECEDYYVTCVLLWSTMPPLRELPARIVSTIVLRMVVRTIVLSRLVTTIATMMVTSFVRSSVALTDLRLRTFGDAGCC